MMTQMGHVLPAAAPRPRAHRPHLEHRKASGGEDNERHVGDYKKRSGPGQRSAFEQVAGQRRADAVLQAARAFDWHPHQLCDTSADCSAA